LQVYSIPPGPPLKNTNQFSGWYFFAYRRVFTGVGAEYCGLRICAPTVIPRTFRYLLANILSSLPTSSGSKSAGRKLQFPFVQWVTRGRADAVFSQHWIAVETLCLEASNGRNGSFSGHSIAAIQGQYPTHC